MNLEDKYTCRSGRVYMSGTQALVRLLLLQKWRDRDAGLNTAGFVSGYRGSPLGSLDRELWRAQTLLTGNDIKFWPGINEDLAATAVWGSQMVGLHGDATVDGVFGLWYGKGAGLDRSGDAMRHANASGVHPRGGVLAVVGDDHAQKSSTQPYFSEPTFADLQMPVLYPSSVTEMFEYGLLGWELSRASGVWVGLKTMAELLDCSASLDEQSISLRIHRPGGVGVGRGGVHFRWPDPWREGEVRWVENRLPAIHAFARANSIDRVMLRSPEPRIGIITAGKSYRDVLQALHDLGLSNDAAAAAGVTIYKVGMTWPLELDGLKEFASGLAELLIVEEKRPVIEDQVRAALYDAPDRPRITGKKDEAGQWQFPWIGELTPDRIAHVLARRLSPPRQFAVGTRRLEALSRQQKVLSMPRPGMARPPYFCSGCPHNTSTRVPEGSRAIGGVGCHYMAVDMDRRTSTFSHMGGEGATWIGQAPFSNTRHVFVNLGEGTYFHSGSLAVRACIAAGVNITYKLLYNDAVAMTGGQPVDGQLTVPQLARQLREEGIRHIRIVAEEHDRYGAAAGFPSGTTIHPRSELDEVQRALSQTDGVSALIYDQTCAAEKRRRRKRKQMVDPARRAFINTSVCEGCGDCSVASNCLSVVPVETELGRKRRIDQSSCNKDLSCLEGFCPSFVTVEGGQLKRPRGFTMASSDRPPEPKLPAFTETYDIFITGVGGTGVVTVGALLGVAAHLEGKPCSILDQLGMAQKGGAVVTHVRLGAPEHQILTQRVPTAGAHLILGFDLAVTLQDAALSKIAAGHTQILVNTHEIITGAFTRDPDLSQRTPEMTAALGAIAGGDRVEAFDATELATALLGDSIATNLFLLGYAYQKGLIPLAGESIREAIRLNGVAVDFGLSTFDVGRIAAFDRAAIELRALGGTKREQIIESVDALIQRRSKMLTEYQDARYAASYSEFLARVKATENARVHGATELCAAVARSLFKLMAYKDEYEVARLYTDGEFRKALRESFEGDYRLRFHLAPPLLARKDARTGRPAKRAFGAWMEPAFRLLAGLRWLRGSRLDPFGYTAERRTERRLIIDYRAVVERLLEHLTPATHALAVEIAQVPLAMRGFGHVKEANIAAALQRQTQLLEELARKRSCNER